MLYDVAPQRNSSGSVVRNRAKVLVVKYLCDIGRNLIQNADSLIRLEILSLFCRSGSEGVNIRKYTDGIAYLMEGKLTGSNSRFKLCLYFSYCFL